ncbi:MAG: thioredoxin family protein [Proteobacteria bacterium]|mgnify:FL=1|jgi:thiol-disulfide isomerase/thioredoxin|nr:thioredoxin family protein [Pseudomonadota bacterium]
MPVQRIDNMSLDRILSGDISKNAECVIKFYSNDCHLCQSLKDYFEDISNEDEFSELHFFAFNIDDNPAVEQRLKFSGVPTITKIKIQDKNSKITVMPEPQNPNPETWYKTREIINFIQQEK